MDNQSNPNENTNKPDLMGYEGQVAPANEITLPANSSEDVQTTINKAVKEVTVDDNGKYVYPENMDPMLKAAVAATKSYRDNQSGFTKSRQEVKELEAEREILRDRLADVTSGHLELTKEQKVELEGLKNTDPDAWRIRLNDIESESKKAIQEELDSTTEEVRSKASGEHELERRYKYLEGFNEGREVEITPELLDNEIPPRITKKLAEGEYSFEEYLDAVSEYLDKGKVVSKVTPTITTDLNKVNGSGEANVAGEDEQTVDYSMQTL